MLRTGYVYRYGFSCIFAALAREIGYTPYMICGRVPGSRDGAADGFTRHCWVKINGLYYDPEAQYAGWMTGDYGYDYYKCEVLISSTRYNKISNTIEALQHFFNMRKNLVNTIFLFN